MTDALAILRYVCEWGLYGIIVFFLLGWIPMPPWATNVARACLIIIGVSAILSVLLAAEPHQVPRLAPIAPGPPSIIR